MKFNEWLKWANENRVEHMFKGNLLLPRLELNDGVSVSVQVGKRWNCYPRENLENGDYDFVEVYGDEFAKFFNTPFDEKEGEYEELTFGMVDIDTMQEFVDLHGGIKIKV